MSASNPNAISRKTFLKTGAGAAFGAVALAVGPTGGMSPAESAPMAAGAFRYFLELDGTVTPLESVQGGMPVGVVAQDGGRPFPKKTIGTVDYEALSIDMVGPLVGPLAQWLAGTLNSRLERKNGSIIVCDFNYDALQRREFSDAFISEITFPALDGSSKDPGYLRVTIEPARIRLTPGTGKVAGPTDNKRQKKWLASNFRFELGDLPCQRINRVEELTVKAKVASRIEPASLEYPNVTFHLPQADIGPWQEWFDDFVINGNCGDDRELTGAITYLAPDLNEELGRIGLDHVGIFAIHDDAAESGRDQVVRYKVELYVEKMDLKLDSAPGVR